MTDQLLLKPEDAAAKLGVSRREIYRLIAAGRIRSVKIGKLRRISQRALEDFVEKAESEGVSQ